MLFLTVLGPYFSFLSKNSVEKMNEEDLSYLAYAFSNRAPQNSEESEEWVKMSWPPWVGRKSSTQTSTHFPKRQNRKRKTPEYSDSSAHSCSL